jgi:hypothetical protein
MTIQLARTSKSLDQQLKRSQEIINDNQIKGSDFKFQKVNPFDSTFTKKDSILHKVKIESYDEGSLK